MNGVIGEVARDATLAAYPYTAPKQGGVDRVHTPIHKLASMLTRSVLGRVARKVVRIGQLISAKRAVAARHVRHYGPRAPWRDGRAV